MIDTPHLLRKIDNINDSCILHDRNMIHVSIDIVNMFTNIPREMGIEQCKKHLDCRENPLFITKCIIKALEITLDNNISQFDKTYYR